MWLAKAHGRESTDRGYRRVRAAGASADLRGALSFGRQDCAGAQHHWRNWVIMCLVRGSNRA